MAYQGSAPALSTPATHIFEHETDKSPNDVPLRLSDEQLMITYEIQRTISEIRRAQYKRIALQFPDGMLGDAPRVFDALRDGLCSSSKPRLESLDANQDSLTIQAECLNLQDQSPEPRFYILGDTSYGACCVDEIAAEHIDADAVVHYGRACLSPTARLPVIYVFTVPPQLALDQLRQVFEKLYGDRQQKIILMADVTYQTYLHDVVLALRDRGYTNLFEAEVQHDPSSPLPNRRIPEEVLLDSEMLKYWHIFHISDPPEALLLTLSSRVASIHIVPARSLSSSKLQMPSLASTTRASNRRYALLSSVNTVSTFGILINTLSVKNYLHMVEHVKGQISAAGKKSYTFVIGKVNAAKIANFSEVGAWVVIGCWESSLIDSKDFWKPIITPFELEVSLKGDEERIWTGVWSSDYQHVLDARGKSSGGEQTNRTSAQTGSDEEDQGDYDSEPESQPPEFDLRTGRYVSHSRPMQSAPQTTHKSLARPHQSSALTKRAPGDVMAVGGEHSPGAEFLQNKRSWKGLGSDFEVAYEQTNTLIEEGRSGIARGYSHVNSQGALL